MVQKGKGGRDRQFAPRVNWNIKSWQCKVLFEGRPPETMNTGDAVRLAESMDLDLVEVGYDRENRISTCKICDYGKYQYDRKRREKEQKKAARAGQADVKSVQISVATDQADLDRFEKRALEFLEEGDNVRLSLRMRNRREMANVEFAKQALRNFVQRFEGKAKMVTPPSISGREITCVIRRA